MSQRYIMLGCGRRIGLARYVEAWKACLALDPKTWIGRGVDGLGQNAGEALRDLRRGLHDRINRHIPGFGQGRKWDSDYQRHIGHIANRLNMRCIIWQVETRCWPTEWQSRFAHRITPDSERF